MPTKRQIIDDIFILATRFGRTDDSRLDETYIGFKIEQIRVAKIIEEYNYTGVIDQNWLVDFGTLPLYPVNFADDPNITHCACDIMKFKLPVPVMNLTALGEGNLDLGLKVISACGSRQYTYYPLERWRMIPSEHVRSLFSYYSRFGQYGYVNRNVNFLRFMGVPETTEGLTVKNTLPVLSGDIKVGVSYTVNGPSITYNSIIYLNGQTFTGVLGITIFTGTAEVNYTNFEAPMTEDDNYPVSAHMARLIALEFMTKELMVEEKQIADIQNDSADDAKK